MNGQCRLVAYDAATATTENESEKESDSRGIFSAIKEPVVDGRKKGTKKRKGKAEEKRKGKMKGKGKGKVNGNSTVVTSDAPALVSLAHSAPQHPNPSASGLGTGPIAAITEGAVWGVHIRHGDVKALSNVYGNRRVFSFKTAFNVARKKAHEYARLIKARGESSGESSGLRDEQPLRLPAYLFVTSDDPGLMTYVHRECKNSNMGHTGNNKKEKEKKRKKTGIGQLNKELVAEDQYRHWPNQVCKSKASCNNPHDWSTLTIAYRTFVDPALSLPLTTVNATAKIMNYTKLT